MSLDEQLMKLNDAQREAVKYTDGPLLVIAGPGTGKTQLLSLRAANILETCDVSPRNILCLTYTDAGSQEMKDRLVELVGRQAYGIEVATFHAFASAVKSRYPQYFRRNPTAVAVSSLHASEIIDAYLKGLPYGSPLAGIYNGVASGVGGVKAFISTVKRYGLTPDDVRAIMNQNIAAADYLDGLTELSSLINEPMPRGKAEKATYVARFEELIHAAIACAPKGLLTPVVSTPGIYDPYLLSLGRKVSSTVLFDGSKTEGFTGIRNTEFKKDDDGIRRASIRKASQKALVACDAYEHYRRVLEQENLIDFDDMVMDCIEAIATNPALKYELQDRYRYIQVDEFQDTNGAQMRLVELLCEGIEHPNVMAVGDDDQAIMRFQGASVAYIEQFRATFGPKSVVLLVNYRSTPEIVALGMGIAEQVEHRLVAGKDKQIVAKNPSGDQVFFAETVFETPELQYRALAKDIRSRLDGGFAGRAKASEPIAVIGAKHAELRALIPFLVEQNVPFAYKVRSNVFEMESMQALLALLRFVAAYSSGRPRQAEAFLPQIIAAPELGGDHYSSLKFALEARKEHGGRWMKAMGASDHPRMKQLYEDLTAWSTEAPAAPVRELIRKIAGRSLGYYANRGEEDPYALAEFNAGIRAILRFAEQEIDVAGSLGRTLRLADVVERLDQAQRFGVDVDAGINLEAPGAIRLTTAHSSKGLQFDLVYLLDADDQTWHASGQSSGLYPGNLLLGDAKDENDARRLLFVAVTRAKSYLELYRAKGSMLREFAGEGEAVIGSRAVGANPEDLGEAIMTDWSQAYRFDTPELRALLTSYLPPKSLSVTALNAFVKYEDGAPAAAVFPEEQVAKLPAPPKIEFDFGNIVHAFFEQYVNRVVRAKDTDGEALARQFAAKVDAMDWREEDVAQYRERFARIVDIALPRVAQRFAGHMETEACLNALVGNDVPLFGKCDLLLIDDEAKTIHVVDYKTGQNYPTDAPDPGYERQLRFYRLLIEHSPEYEGYRVVACEDWYIEPDKATGEMREPVVVSVTDDEVASLLELVNAVWRRLCFADFDVSGFEDSDLKAAALKEAEASKANKAQKARMLQRAFDRWLVEAEEE
ncbi:MAG: ATP-dependent helicase [Eggerthellaceae bacterium]|nr:ATP-dependent helicase [Eggerthellaceae bacterium]